MDLEHKQKPSEKWQILAVCTGSLLSIVSGMLFCWPSPSVPKLQDPNGPYNFTSDSCSYLPFISNATIFIFSPFPGYIVDRFGRKPALFFVSILFASSCLCNLFGDDIRVFYLGRVFSGCADCSLYAAFPIYIGEVTSPKVRGTWGNTFCVLNFLGMLLVSVFGGYTSIKVTAAVTFGFVVMFWLVFPFMGESPYFFIVKGKSEKARKVLRWFRGVEDVEKEIEVIQGDIKRQKSEPHGWKDLFGSSTNRASAVAVIFLLVAQQAAGFTVFAVYTHRIFKSVAGNISEIDSVIVYNVAVFLTAFTGSIITDKLGRKKALIYSFLGGGLILSFVAFFFYFDSYSNIDMNSLQFVPLLGMVVYIVVWSFGIAIVPILMLSELFSTAMQRKGLILANIIFGLSAYLVTLIFEKLDEALGLYAPFAFFSLCCFISIYLSHKLVPETKGKTLEEIQMTLLKENQTVKETELNIQNC